MYDINKRKEIKNPKVKDIVDALKDLPEDADVYFSAIGGESIYIHVKCDEAYVRIDSGSMDGYLYGLNNDNRPETKQSGVYVC